MDRVVDLLRKAASTYLLVITRRNGSEILVLPDGPGWSLPQADIDPEQRLAEQLTAQTARAWKIETFCLRPTAVQNGSVPLMCAVMEAVRQNEKAPPGSYWMPRTAAERCCDSAGAAAVRESLERLEACTRSQSASPFARYGWMRELFGWAQDQIAPHGLRLTGAFRQMNASPRFSLIRLETSSGAVWFKATGDPNAHELPVTLALAELFPRYLPRILGVHHAWNGWLSEEAPGTALDEITDFAAWEQMANELARLQIASIGKADQLFKSQLRDLRIGVLAERIDPFLSRMSEMMSAQQKPSPAPLVSSELETLGQRLKESCALLDNLRFPDTVGHMDCNPGNIFVSRDRCVFLDWSEGSVTNPLVTLQLLREYLVRSGIDAPAGSERLAQAYLQAWAQFYSPAELKLALELMPLLAVFAFAVSMDSWRTLDPRRDHSVSGYYRGLVRRMYREATEAAQRSEACLS